MPCFGRWHLPSFLGLFPSCPRCVSTAPRVAEGRPFITLLASVLGFLPSPAENTRTTSFGGTKGTRSSSATLRPPRPPPPGAVALILNIPIPQSPPETALGGGSKSPPAMTPSRGGGEGCSCTCTSNPEMQGCSISPHPVPTSSLRLSCGRSKSVGGVP